MFEGELRCSSTSAGHFKVVMVDRAKWDQVAWIYSGPQCRVACRPRETRVAIGAFRSGCKEALAQYETAHCRNGAESTASNSSCNQPNEPADPIGAAAFVKKSFEILQWLPGY